MHYVILIIITCATITAINMPDAEANLPTANFRVTDIDSGATTLKWNAVSGAVFYSVDLKLDDRSIQLPEISPRVAWGYHGADSGDVLTYEFIAYDGDWDRIAQHEITVTVPANAVPNVTIVHTGSTTVYANERIRLESTVTDEHPSYLVYRWSNAYDAGMNCARCDHVSVKTPNIETGSAEITMRLRVTDINGDVGEDTLTFTVIPRPNNHPVADAGNNRVRDEGHNIKISGHRSYDPDGIITSYLWTQIGGSPTLALSDPTATQPTFDLPEVNRDTVFAFQLTVTDNDNATDTDVVRITARNIPNNAPTVNAGSDQVVASGDSVTLQARANDPDGDNMTFAWTQQYGPTVTLASADTRAATFMAPTVTTPTKLVFSFTATDDESGTATDHAQVIVTDLAAPVANAGRNQAVTSQQTVTLNGSGSVTDPDGSPTYSWRQTEGTTVSLSGRNTETPTFTAPSVGSGNTMRMEFELTVTDGFQSDTDKVILTVVQNEAPTAEVVRMSSLGPVKSGSIVKLAGYGIDVNGGDTLTYSWQRVSGPGITMVDSSRGDVYDGTLLDSRKQFEAPRVTLDTDVQIRFRVVDHLGLAASDTHTITITGNSPPIVDAGNDINARDGSRVTLDGKVRDPDGDSLTYGWEQTGGDDVLPQAQKTVKKPSFVIPASTQTQTMTFVLTASDGTYEASDTVLVNVKENLHAPVADAGNDRTASSGSTVRLSGSGHDQDGDQITYEWSWSSGLSVTLTDADTQRPSFTAPTVREVTTTVIALKVSDGEFTDIDTVTITVNPTDRIPTVDAGADVTVFSGEMVTLDGSGSDPEGKRVSYLWDRIRGPNNISIQNPDRANASFVAPAVTSTTTYTLRLTVTEGSDSVSDTVRITVKPNGEHTISAGNDLQQIRKDGGMVALDGTVLTNPDNDPLTFTWSLVAHDRITEAERADIVSDISGNREDVSFSPPAANGAFLMFTLTVSDGSYSVIDFTSVYLYE